MSSIRRHILRHRMVAVWLVALALAMKALVPTGFMPIIASNGTITVEICGGSQHQTVTMTIPGLAKQQDQPGKQGKTDMPCAFSGLSMQGLAAADPIALALAILFILATGLRETPQPTARQIAFLRPPLRGPPALS